MFFIYVMFMLLRGADESENTKKLGFSSDDQSERNKAPFRVISASALLTLISIAIVLAPLIISFLHSSKSLNQLEAQPIILLEGDASATLFDGQLNIRLIEIRSGNDSSDYAVISLISSSNYPDEMLEPMKAGDTFTYNGQFKFDITVLSVEARKVRFKVVRTDK